MHEKGMGYSMYNDVETDLFGNGEPIKDLQDMQIFSGKYRRYLIYA